MRTALKFAVSRRKEGEALGLEAPNELDAIAIFRLPEEQSRHISSNLLALANLPAVRAESGAYNWFAARATPGRFFDKAGHLNIGAIPRVLDFVSTARTLRLADLVNAIVRVALRHHFRLSRVSFRRG